MRKAFLFLLLCWTVSSVAQVRTFDYRGDTQRQPTTLSVTFTADKYQIVQDKSGLDQVVMENYGFVTQPRDPMLPMKVFEVLVPPNIDWTTIRLQTTIEASEPLPGKHKIKPVPVPRPIEPVPPPPQEPSVEPERNLAVYGANAIFPKTPVTSISQSQMRKWRFVRLAFVPIQYNPVDGTLVLIKSVRVQLDLSRIGTRVFRSDPLLRDRVLDPQAEKRFVNFQQAKPWYAPTAEGPLPVTGNDYVIITTNAIQAGSTALADFINHKQTEGHSVRVVTETDYGALTGQAPNGTAEKIRQWLIDNYASMGIEWVLLVGNPDPGVGDVPMKMMWPRVGATSFTQWKESPTDYFYSDLTGNWDLDGDGVYGEGENSHPDSGAGGVDFTPEVYVGRLPVYNADYASLDQVLNKIIAYESASTIPHWRRHTLFGMAYLWDPCSDWQLGESIISDYADKLGFHHYRHYEENTTASPEASPVLGHPPAYPPHPPDVSPTAPDNMLKEWANNNANDGYGVVVWSTHGWSGGAQGLMTSPSCSQLNDQEPSFVFHGSCLNGEPEDSNNLGYSLLKQGAIATVSASRVSWSYCFGPPANFHSAQNCNLSYFYNRRLMNGEPVGRALYDTKAAADAGADWMNKFDFNLYGDPTTALLAPYRVADVDLVPVLDHSGSMAMSAAASQTSTKIDVLKDATNQLVDMMDASGANQLGLVQFTTTADTLINLAPFTATSRASAHTKINTINPTNLTSIGDGLQHAMTEFTSHAAAGHRRVMLLVTDGLENTAPMIAAIRPSIIANGVTVFPLGLGYSYGVDEARLIDLANATGGDYRITDDELIFRKYFIEILGSATDWSVVTDPLFTLAGGQSDSVPVTVTPGDTAVLFTVYWGGYDNAVKLLLQAPDGQVYDYTSPAYVGAKRYAIYRIDLDKVPDSQRTGRWLMKFTADQAALGANTVRVSASALAKTNARISAGLDKPVILTGDSSHLRVRLTHDGHAISGATITAYYDRPTVGFGNVMHDHAGPIPTITRGPRDARSPVQLKVAHLRETLGKQFMPRTAGTLTLYDDGTHGDAKANDGIYTGTFADTKIPGTYVFRFVASDIRVGDVTTSREWAKYLHVIPGSDPHSSDLQTRLAGRSRAGSRYSVRVIPRDRFGNYLGPGHKVTVAISAARELAPREVELKDNLDGSYSGEAMLARPQLVREAKLNVSIDGRNFMSTNLDAQ